MSTSPDVQPEAASPPAGGCSVPKPQVPRLANPLASFAAATTSSPAQTTPVPAPAVATQKKNAPSKAAHLAAVAQQVQADPTKLPGIVVESAPKVAKHRKPFDPNAVAKKPPPNVIQPELLCKRAWCDDNVGGTEGAFKSYWEGLSPEERQVWILESARVQQAKRAAKVGGGAA
ncbi:hypothetical protein AURDEDRAFT_115838 [Auricularia subglabra TFB-10046 SS5]|nr:hypothetical protein AURDEDRAFT_115838 [Auricularia subglabra TFB-10046 SS5]